MRQRDERLARQGRFKNEVLHDKKPIERLVKWFRPEDFQFIDAHRAICPAGCELTGNGTLYEQGKRRFRRYEAQASDCQGCAMKLGCLRNPAAWRGRQVAKFEAGPLDEDSPAQRMQRAIDSPRGRQLYSRRIATVEPVFANVRHHKGMRRFTLRGKAKVGVQWLLYCLVHNIEKIAHRGDED